MNTAACCLDAHAMLPTPSPLQRAGAAARRWRRAWAEAVSRRRCERALAGLSEATLRDIGVAACVRPRQPSLTLIDHERGLW